MYQIILNDWTSIIMNIIWGGFFCLGGWYNLYYIKNRYPAFKQKQEENAAKYGDIKLIGPILRMFFKYNASPRFLRDNFYYSAIAGFVIGGFLIGSALLSALIKMLWH